MYPLAFLPFQSSPQLCHFCCPSESLVCSGSSAGKAHKGSGALFWGPFLSRNRLLLKASYQVAFIVGTKELQWGTSSPWSKWQFLLYLKCVRLILTDTNPPSLSLWVHLMLFVGVISNPTPRTEGAEPHICFEHYGPDGSWFCLTSPLNTKEEGCSPP